ncbi:hypothetical protein [Altererythrobacter sp. Root672]|uniref:hypothetical protein n=1 Tax=Altererythrobacter sp. Root672 TaxID=1736584 RepID=UPI0006FF14DE|nr:hypothetical protein [Altererythrobacter sp. Root672]KRA83019.1 hypothetical protein ASD76_02740 [Altererythrobacter sp. Root672]
MTGNIVEVKIAPWRSYPEAFRTVMRTQKLCANVPMVIGLVLLGLGILPSLVQLKVFSAIFGGIVSLIMAGIIIWIVDAVVLNPLKNSRFRFVAKTLLADMCAMPQAVSQTLSWYSPVPGALVVTQRGNLVIVDRSTNYDEIWLHPSQVLNVSVEREETFVTNTKHGSSFSLGSVSPGWMFASYNSRSKSKSVTHKLETAFLEIRYQVERNGAVHTAVIPFGDDRLGADAWRATLSGLSYVEEVA